MKKRNKTNCAIFGGIGISKNEVSIALNAMGRGDDGISINSLSNVILGHRRHKIISDNKPNVIDGESDQPYYSSDNKISLIFNGELFNYFEMKERLIKNGYIFETDGDTEVLLNLYLEECDQMFKDKTIDFMFAMAIIDLNRNKIILARDWPGRIPLFFVKDIDSNLKTRIIFSSEIKGLLTVEGVSIDNIKELTPGNIAYIDLLSNEIMIKNFYIPTHIVSPNSSMDIGKKLLKLLDSSCERRLVGDQLPALLFSGGLDSLLTALCTIRAARKSGIKDDLMCYVFALKEYDSEDVWRTKRALKYLKRLGLSLKEVRMDAEKIVEDTPDFIYNFEAMSPSAVSFYPLPIYYYLSHKIAQDGFKAAIGGDGPDELLGAYDTWKEMNLSHNDMSSYEQRNILMNNIHEAILKRGSIMMMEKGPVEMRFPFLETHVSEFLLSIHPRWLVKSSKIAKEIKEELKFLKPFDDKLLGDNFLLYLNYVEDNKEINFPLLFEYDKLFWKIPLFMAGLEICKDMDLEPDILISPKLRSQHGAGLTSLEKKIMNRFKQLNTKTDKELFKKIWKLLFVDRLSPNDIKNI